jgi:hypothetical protein
VSAPRPLLLGELQTIAAAVWGPKILDSISARSRAVLLVDRVLDDDERDVTKAEAEAIRRSALDLRAGGAPPAPRPPDDRTLECPPEEKSGGPA